jgi:putative addiction module component (TIGR02574 family)
MDTKVHKWISLCDTPLPAHTRTTLIIICHMSSITEIEPLALKLSVSERATLASHLLDSLPEVLSDEDGGTTEALRRREELLQDPGTGMTMDDLRNEISKRFRI